MDHIVQRIVVVTGGSSGIGRVVASRFCESGTRVIITGRDRAKLETAASDMGAEAVVCDGTQPDQVGALRKHVGPELDVLVNMAGGNTDFTRPSGAGISDEGTDLAAIASAWRANLDANLISAVLATTAFTDALRSGGAVINVGSIGAEYASTSYGAAKAALAAWTAGVSANLGPKGVTVNTISPGYIEGTEFFQGQLSEQRRETLIASTHNGRAGTVADIAETAFFLASPGARHITGQVLHVNGGAHTTR